MQNPREIIVTLLWAALLVALIATMTPGCVSSTPAVAPIVQPIEEVPILTIKECQMLMPNEYTLIPKLSKFQWQLLTNYYPVVTQDLEFTYQKAPVAL